MKPLRRIRDGRGATRGAQAVNLTRRRLAMALPAAGLAGPLAAAPPGGGRPNILFIVVDDMDYRLFTHMGKLRRLVTEPGMEFGAHFISLTLCCPSRATMLRGQFAHNSGITNNIGPYGGFEKFFLDGLEASTYASWLRAAGYRTAMMGKYLNNYPSPESGALHIPPGWDTWFVPNGGTYYTQTDYTVNDDGVERAFGRAAEDHFHDVMTDRALRFVRQAGRDAPSRPFFLVVAPFLPHGPCIAPPRYRGLFEGVRAPRSPSFNEADVSDKPVWLQRTPLMDGAALGRLDFHYRKRRQAAQAIDDMVASLVTALRNSGQLDNTYVFFTSDNGFFMGEHRIPGDKRRPYEPAIRAPLVVRGPGIPAGRVVRELSCNADFAPTFAALAGVAPPAFVDGRSLRPLFSGAPPARWRRSLLLESQPPEVNSIYQSYAGLRTATRQTFVLWNYGFGEYYDMRTDPEQMTNAYYSMPAALKAALRARVEALKTARGAALRRLEEEAVTA
ncbi:sulfatase family protein [Azohydromonas aeria]|uniref:sulfatase family protein n=1 Tax=Azohydromonas aeria TaxID=2590212 RepID=UPI0012F7FDEE|nr:sulfatase [Azohydromonas aeria]